jgi:hypothetical protein
MKTARRPQCATGGRSPSGHLWLQSALQNKASLLARRSRENGGGNAEESRIQLEKRQPTFSRGDGRLKLGGKPQQSAVKDADVVESLHALASAACISQAKPPTQHRTFSKQMFATCRETRPSLHKVMSSTAAAAASHQS